MAGRTDTADRSVAITPWDRSVAKAAWTYTPRHMPAAEWAVAQESVLWGVRAANQGLGRASCVREDLRQLCRFLHLNPEWDHQSPPDLLRLLTEQSIDQHHRRLVDLGVSDAHRRRARSGLRRILRALRGGRPNIKSPISMRQPAYLLHHLQLHDLVQAALSPREHGCRPGALALAVQIGAGLSAERVARLHPADVRPDLGAVRVNGVLLGVLGDAQPFLAAARAELVSGPLDARGLLPDALARPLWLLAHLQAGTPLSVLDLASVAATGKGLRRHELETLLTYLDRSEVNLVEGNASRPGHSTVTSDSATAVRALQMPLTVGGPEVQQPVTTPNTSPQPRPARRHSRAADQRAAKLAYQESLQQRDPLYLDLDLCEVPGWTSLRSGIQARVRDYRPVRVPAKQWVAVEDLARRLLVLRLALVRVDNDDAGRRRVNVIGSHLAPYLVWVHENLQHERRDELVRLVLEETSLDRYTDEALHNVPRGTVATRRSEVRSVLRAARPGPHPAKLHYRPVQPPYTAAEAAHHERLARNQPTAARRRGLAFIIAAGYGAGLDGRDMATVRACDILTLDIPTGEQAVAIRVGGERPRIVVVRSQYVELLLLALKIRRTEHRGTKAMMLGEKPNRRNITAPVLERLVTASGAEVQIDVPRLRSTWLVAHMSASVPLGTLLAAAGLRSARAIVDLLPFVTPPDTEQAIQLLRGTRGLLPLSPTAQAQEARA